MSDGGIEVLRACEVYSEAAKKGRKAPFFFSYGWGASLSEMVWWAQLYSLPDHTPAPATRVGAPYEGRGCVPQC